MKSLTIAYAKEKKMEESDILYGTRCLFYVQYVGSPRKKRTPKDIG